MEIKLRILRMLCASVREWWNSPEVAKARESLSNELAVKNSHIVGDLARVLKNVTLEIPLKSD